MSEKTPQVLFANRRPGLTTSLREFEQGGGYRGLRRALGELSPEDVRRMVSESGLRGRGGAGFPTGVKWSFFPHDAPPDKYLVANCDEMEPGTYKDGELIRADPHQLVEGLLVSAYALGANRATVFIRYDYESAACALERAIAEAREAGYLGERILGTDFSLEIHVHRSAGRYILGEETALLNGLEGRRPNPRLRPPFPAQKGLFGRPTNVQNVETLACVPHIVSHGPQWFRGLAAVKEGAGTKLFGLSGHLNATECFELPIGTTLREIVERWGGGVWRGRRFKACLPGGASTPYLDARHLDVPMDFSALEKAGSRLGTAGVTVFDDRTCMLRVTHNLISFFARESCGFCTPCREGLPMVRDCLARLEAGRGTLADVDWLREQVSRINLSFCALAQGAMGPLESLLRLFGDEVLDHVGRGRCPLGEG